MSYFSLGMNYSATKSQKVTTEHQAKTIILQIIRIKVSVRQKH